MMTAPERREAVLDDLHHAPGVTAELARDPPTPELPDESPLGQRLLRVNLTWCR